MQLGRIALLFLLALSPAAFAQGKEARLEECRSKLKAAASLDLLKDMSFSGGHPKVVIGRTWYTLDYGAKTGFAETAACFFLAGDTSKAITFPILDNMTGKKVATWKFTKLEVE